jgi:hypothetical protein
VNTFQAASQASMPAWVSKQELRRHDVFDFSISICRLAGVKVDVLCGRSSRTGGVYRGHVQVTAVAALQQYQNQQKSTSLELDVQLDAALTLTRGYANHSYGSRTFTTQNGSGSRCDRLHKPCHIDVHMHVPYM